MSSVKETQLDRLSPSDPTTLHNSPIAYGLGSFGLEAAFKVFAGYYVFFYVDMLGLAIALAAIINIIYALWDAVNDPLVGYLSNNTRPELHPVPVEQFLAILRFKQRVNLAELLIALM